MKLREGLKKEDFYKCRMYFGSNPEENKEIQLILFKLGFKWINQGAWPLWLKDTWVIMDKTYGLAHGHSIPYYKHILLSDLIEPEQIDQEEDIDQKNKAAFEKKYIKREDMYIERLKIELESHGFYTITEDKIESLLSGANPSVINYLKTWYPNAKVFKEEKTYKLGDRFKYMDGSEYILSSIGGNIAAFISLKTGRVFFKSTVNHYFYIKEAELQKGYSLFKDHFTKIS